MYRCVSVEFKKHKLILLSVFVANPLCIGISRESWLRHRVKDDGFV